MSNQLLLVLAVALMMAQCGLGAIWWARNRWSPSARTLAVGLFCAGLWAILVGLLDTARHSGPAAAAWAASLATQTAVTALAVVVIELAINFRATAAGNRFSIVSLLLWTSAIAAWLAGARIWAAQHGWSIGDVSSWEFFRQLQCVAIANSVLAVAIYAAVTLPRTRRARALVCIAVAAAIAVVAPLGMLGLFGNKAGATPVEMIWLFGGEALFLIATLVPMEMARKQAVSNHQSSAVISKGSSSAACWAR